MERALTLNEVANLLKVYPSRILQASQKGQIPAFKVGVDSRFKPDLMEQWIRQRETAASFEKIIKQAPDPISG